MKSLLLLLLAFCFSRVAHSQSSTNIFTNSPTSETIMLPPTVPDPIEPVNRAMWAFNKALMTDVINPTSRAYRFVVRKPVRTGIGNMGHNILYPGRVINNMLQGKWNGARDETYRFLCNTIVGVVGFFDVATKWEIPKSEADFGQTFGLWGWNPVCYLMLPVFGPSNERDTLGLAADTAANPLLYISPYNFEGKNPLTWLGPYSYFSYGVMYNNLSDSVIEYVRYSKAEEDPYSEIQFAWTFARDIKTPDFHVKGPQDPAALETLASAFFTYTNEEFPNYAQTYSVRIPATGHQLKFTSWMQPHPAPVVYIIPGLGSHRLAQASIALAELAFNNGYSAVCVSSAFNFEFMENASTAWMPAYVPVDGHDMQVALTQIDGRLQKLYPGRIQSRALMGYSMGALHSLYIGSTQATNQAPLIKFDRVVAIDTPVRLIQGISKLDEFYRAPLEWPANERTDDIENAFLKTAALAKATPSPQAALPFSGTESKFLIGMTFRMILRDVIYTSQKHHNQGVLRHRIRTYRRKPLYDEILQYSYQDYFEKFAIPYYQQHGLGSSAADTLEKAGDLRSYEAGLRDHPEFRVLVNHDDFLLNPDDLAWLHATFNDQQLTVFDKGGHLGNLGDPAVQKAIISALDGLKNPPSKSQ